jgi:periplasmic protein TonB
VNAAIFSKFAGRSAVVPATGAAVLFSLLLFGLMYSVIRVGGQKLDKPQALQTIDFVRLKRDSDLETLSRRKPPPPPPAQPPPPAKMRIASAGGTQTALTGLDIPNLNLTADLGAGVSGMKSPAPSAMFDGEIVPLQCPPPIYPSEARRAGITGWVQVELVVSPDGSVRSAKAIDAQPRGMFEAAAVMSQQKCKFKPKIVDGVATEQKGRRKLNFGLNKAEGD